MDGGLKVDALVSRLHGPDSNSGKEHWVVFLGKTLYSHTSKKIKSPLLRLSFHIPVSTDLRCLHLIS